MEYAEKCSNFKFYYPNGVPDDAKRRCEECINLDEKQLGETHCQIPFQEMRRKAFEEAKTKGQQVIA